jgi:ABC-2 type transport system ATP-binding protein
MDSIRKSLGSREYQVIFKADQTLDLEKSEGNYVYKTSDVAKIAGLLRQISDNNWALADLSVKQSALEDIYVKLMTSES